MIQIRRASACFRLPNLRQPRLRLYALFIAVVVLFLLVTLSLDSIHYWIRSEEIAFMPAVRWQRVPVIPNPVNTKVDRLFNVLKELASAPYIPKKESVELHQLNPSKIYPRAPPHIVWDTSLRQTDRILEQLSYIPHHRDTSKILNILVWQKGGGERIIPGSSQFTSDNCLVSNCFIANNVESVKHADAVITSWPLTEQNNINLFKNRTMEDVWIFYDLESPESLLNTADSIHGFNWTATYRHDSTIVAPYEKWVPFENATQMGYFQATDLLNHANITLDKNYAFGKTKMAAALISNCGAGVRLKVVHALSRHIKVDVYGACGVSCDSDCFYMLNRDYKFYLAFENSNCVDYITEKFFRNGLGNNIVPVVFGAPIPDYLQVAPPYSYIHVDNFPSVMHLARYLKDLDQNDTLYNFYFKWKGTGSFINTKFWCRLCAMLNDLDKPHLVIPDVNKWLTDRTCHGYSEPQETSAVDTEETTPDYQASPKLSSIKGHFV